MPLWPSHHTRSPNSGWQRLSGQAFFSDNPLPSLSFTDGSTHPGLEVIRFLFIFCFVSIFLKLAFLPYVVFVSREGRSWVPVDRCCFVPCYRGLAAHTQLP